MIYAFSNPFTPSFVEQHYTCYPVPTFISTQNYTSTCGPDSKIPDIFRTSDAFSFTSQSNADNLALTAATSLALSARVLIPCPNY